MNATSRFACSEVKELADAYVDNETPIATTLLIVGHTRDCRDCREWIHGTTRLKSEVQDAVRRIITPAHFRHQLRDAIQKAG